MWGVLPKALVILKSVSLALVAKSAVLATDGQDPSSSWSPTFPAFLFYKKKGDSGRGVMRGLSGF